LSNFANESEAIDAAASAFQAENGSAPSPTPSPTPEPVAPQPSEPEVVKFTDINPEDLPDELKPVYKSMQADYTRKTQEVAPWRKLQDAGISPDDAMQSAQFLYELNTNPEFQRAVYDRLNTEFQAAGASPQEAAQAAAAAVSSNVPDDDDLDLLPPEVTQKLSQLDELMEWKNQQEEERELLALEADLTRAEVAIQQANPHYTDEDMARVRQIGFSTGGDLFAAQQIYDGWRNDIVSGYVGRKETANTQAPASPHATGHSQQPAKYASIDEAHDAAIARLTAEFGADY
jgi:hypothetical protein